MTKIPETGYSGLTGEYRPMHDLTFWRKKLLPYTKKSDAIAFRQIIVTLIPFVGLWAAYIHLVEQSIWYFIPFSFVVSFFILRCFVLMHDCGHKAMFKTMWMNKFFGYLMGVITGMPQAVWSKNHDYHHNTNGDWVKYGGVFNIITTQDYAALSDKKKKHYWWYRQPIILIPAGFFYVLFNPRFNWAVGILVMLVKLVKSIITLQFSKAVDDFQKWETKFWKSKQDFWHMTYNNLLLLAIWVVMIQWIGALEFFALYVVSTSLSGTWGILLFTIQHNFEHAYATDTQHVNHYRAALEGTSMLVQPRIFNWFTADIAYHHLHHLSVAIPNYRLEACHKEWEHLFKDVKRVKITELLTTFDYMLWDPQLQKVVSRESILNT